jgi:5-methylcytosine-specific restriction endonuclease McrA
LLQLDFPDIDNIGLWDEIVSNKRGIRKENLLLCRQQVLDRYTFYQSHYESLEEIAPLDAPHWENIKEDLQSCYGNNVAFDRARKVLLSVVPKCPYCLISRPNTLDHYFDKSDYPEYSVFTPNLIPCCSECNSLKGTSLFDDSQQRQFIHFYLDNIPDYQYLFVRFIINPPESIPQISVYLQFHENEQLEQQIRNHFFKLGLLKKYKNMIADRLSIVIEEIRIAKNSGMALNRIREALTIQYQALRNTYKNNYWETCMYEGLFKDEEILETFFNSELSKPFHRGTPAFVLR